MGELKRRQDETDEQSAARVEESLERYKSRHKAYYEANKERIKSLNKAYYEANKERYKAYREANKERINEYAKAYREANKERIKERDKAIHKAYYEANKERISARHKAYREANKERISARHKAYHEANKDREKAYREARKERTKEYNAQYYEANKERISARRKACREANKERTKEYSAQYYEANKERIKARKKEYNEANKERIKARQKAYRGANKERIKARRKAYYESHRARLCVLRVRSYEKRRFERTGIPLGMRVNSIGEEMVRICLDELGVPYKREKRFAWLRCEAQMRLDFYLPELNMAIEYDGIQHKELVAWYRIARKNTKFFGEAGFDAYKMRDALKDMLCTEHGIKVVRIDKSIDSLEKMRKVVREILTQRRMNYAAGALLLVKSIEARRDELGERRAHAEIMAALDAFDAIVADMLDALYIRRPFFL